jgi:hypothetical protein
VKTISQFIVFITLYVLVFFDHHQACMNKNSKCTLFMLNYMMEVYKVKQICFKIHFLFCAGRSSNNVTQNVR